MVGGEGGHRTVNREVARGSGSEHMGPSRSSWSRHSRRAEGKLVGLAGKDTPGEQKVS